MIGNQKSDNVYQGYEISKKGSENYPDPRKGEVPPQKMMVIKCVQCGKSFDSSFSVEDFGNLSAEQLESGTLHLCTHCGHLGLYRLRDYIETRS